MILSYVWFFFCFFFHSTAIIKVYLEKQNAFTGSACFSMATASRAVNMRVSYDVNISSGDPGYDRTNILPCTQRTVELNNYGQCPYSHEGEG